MKNKILEIRNTYSNLGLAKRYVDKEFLEAIYTRTRYLPETCILSERFYHIENDLVDIPLCYCGNELKWHKTSYRNYCSCACSANAEDTKIKRKLYMQTTYGVLHNMQLETCKDKRKQTYIENYGVDNPSKSSNIKQKKESTCMVNHGVRVGVMTNNCKEAIFNKFGVYNVSHIPEIHDKQQSYRWKQYTLPSGKQIKVQGYEPLALDELLNIYQEQDIITRRKEIPPFWYFFPSDNKLHRYYPDIYIPKDNLIIEVKSTWTYNQYITKNKAKEQCVLESGFNYKLMVY